MADEGPNWLGLLKWSLAHTDGTGPSDAKAMSDEDKAFLTKVMEEGIKNEPQRMREIMLNIAVFLEEEIEESKSPSEGFSALSREEQSEKLIDELEELQDIVEQIDMAQVFACKMDGLGCILDLVEDRKGALVGSDIEVRIGACSVLGTLSQNNPQVQEVMYSRGHIGRLQSLVIRLLTLPATPTSSGPAIANDGTADVDRLGFTLGVGVSPPGEGEGGIHSVANRADVYRLASKVLYATSCGVRSHQAAETAWIQGQYGPTVIRAMLKGVLAEAHVSADDERLVHTAVALCRKRALFLASALLTSELCPARQQRMLLQSFVPHCYAFALGREPQAGSTNTVFVGDAATEPSDADALAGLEDFTKNLDIRETTLRLLKNAILLPSGEGMTSIRAAEGGELRLQELLTQRLVQLQTRVLTLRERLSVVVTSSSSEEMKEDLEGDIELVEGESRMVTQVQEALANPPAPVERAPSTAMVMLPDP